MEQLQLARSQGPTPSACTAALLPSFPATARMVLRANTKSAILLLCALCCLATAAAAQPRVLPGGAPFLSDRGFPSRGAKRALLQAQPYISPSAYSPMPYTPSPSPTAGPYASPYIATPSPVPTAYSPAPFPYSPSPVSYSPAPYTGSRKRSLQEGRTVLPLFGLAR